MLLWIWKRNDETGLLDDEFRDGDVMQTRPDSFEPSIGASEKLSWLIVKIPDPPNLAKVTDELARSEYAPGPSAEEPAVVRRKRIFRLDWREKFSAPEIATLEAGLVLLPDGNTAAGGTVSGGVVSGLFTIADFRRK